MIPDLYKIEGINKERNDVAHSLKEIRRVNLIPIVQALKNLLVGTYKFNGEIFNIYETKNQEIKDLL
jgi:hypothetical protein